MTNQQMITEYPEDAEQLTARLQSHNWFSKLALVASSSNSLFSRKGKYGGGDDYVVKVRGVLIAVSFEDKDGDRHYLDLLPRGTT